MGRLVDEVKLWNTPILGAFILWRFTQGYCAGHPNGDAPIGLLHFVASAILTNKKLLKPVTNQRDGLQSYARSFEESKQSDILLSIQQRVKDKREYTLASIDIAISEGLVMWDIESGKIYPRALNKKPSRGKGLKTPIKRIGDQAEILGKWFSKHDLITIEAYLKVVF
ncbi:three component ABC system middle component [Paenibacillus sp. FSL R5-0473]|uniref:three component ABC system middle component n=1 Tax=Paenibacillus sp. FSL R5-0473 TaxID=2921642 RepID=UPI0030F579B6